MLVLPVATLSFNSIPSIRFNEPDDFADFHHASLCPMFRDLIEAANRCAVLDRERLAALGFGDAKPYNLILPGAPSKTWPAPSTTGL
jgi:hypothetical protein